MLTALAVSPGLAPDALLPVTFDDEAVDGSRVGLVSSVAYPANEIMEAMLLTSGNDAAQVLARTAGSVEAGVALMNDTARALGAYDTRARTPHGLDADGQVSSVYDLALLGRALLDDPYLAGVVATRCSDITAPEGARFEICNHNRLVLGQEPGALGIKNGYTRAAGASFVGAVERDGRRLLVTLLSAAPRVDVETLALLDWADELPADARVGALVEPEDLAPPAEGRPGRAAVGGAGRRRGRGGHVHHRAGRRPGHPGRHPLVHPAAAGRRAAGRGRRGAADPRGDAGPQARGGGRGTGPALPGSRRHGGPAEEAVTVEPAVVHWYNQAKGYGFLRTDDGAEVFVRYTAVDVPGYKALEQGQRVSARVVPTDRGPEGHAGAAGRALTQASVSGPPDARPPHKLVALASGNSVVCDCAASRERSW